MRLFYKSKLPLSASCLAFLTLAGLCSARADEAACEPAKLASKYPGLVGKTIKVGQDGESVPFSTRDPKDFTKLVGLDADLAQATFACIGVPMQFQIGTWAGLIPAAMSGQAIAKKRWRTSAGVFVTAWRTLVPCRCTSTAAMTALRCTRCCAPWLSESSPQSARAAKAGPACL